MKTTAQIVHRYERKDACHSEKKQEKCKHSSTDKWVNQYVNHPAATLFLPIKELFYIKKQEHTLNSKRRFKAIAEPSCFFEK